MLGWNWSRPSQALTVWMSSSWLFLSELLSSIVCRCFTRLRMGMAMMANKETKETAPVPPFLNATQAAEDAAQVNEAARGKFLSVLGFALTLLRNYDPFKTPPHFEIVDFFKKMDKTFNATGCDSGSVKGDLASARHNFEAFVMDAEEQRRLT